MRWLVLMSLFGVFVIFTMGISGQSLVIVILAVAITLVVVYYEEKLKPHNTSELRGSSNAEPDAKKEKASDVELIKLINQQGFDLLSPFYFDGCKEFNILTPQEKGQSLSYFHELLNQVIDKYGSIKNLHKLPLNNFLALHEQGIYKMEIESPKRIARYILYSPLSLFVQCPNIENEMVEENWESLVNCDGSDVNGEEIHLLAPETATPRATLTSASEWPFTSGSRP